MKRVIASMGQPEATGRTELHPPKDRFEWERIVRRCRLDHRHIAHLLPEDTRRPVAGTLVKAVALTLATYGNRDGADIYPGAEKLGRVLCSSSRGVSQALAVLRHVGLVERVHLGSRTAREADEYRLTVPADLLEVVPMLDPRENDPQDESSGGAQDESSGGKEQFGTGHRTRRHGAPDETAGAPDETAGSTGRVVRPPSPDHGSTTSRPSTDQVAAATPDRAREDDITIDGAETYRRARRVQAAGR